MHHRPLLPALFLLLTSFAIAASSQTLTAGTAVIMDSNDQIVGPVIGVPELSTGLDNASLRWVYAALFVDDQPTLLGALYTVPLQLRGAGATGPVRFTAPNCQGDAYLPAFNSGSQEGHFVPSFAVNPPGQTTTMYLLPFGTISEPASTVSAMSADGSCSAAMGNGTYYPVVAVPTPFRGPYRIAAASAPVPGGGTPLPVPAAHHYGLVALAIALGAAGVFVFRRM